MSRRRGAWGVGLMAVVACSSAPPPVESRPAGVSQSGRRAARQDAPSRPPGPRSDIRRVAGRRAAVRRVPASVGNATPDPNGKVVRVRIESAPSVVFRLAFYAGSIDDPVGKEGLTRLTARLMLEGGTKSLSYSQLLERLYPWAAEMGVHTDKEQTVFFGRVHRDHATDFVLLLADIMTRPRLDPDAFARLRQDQLNDLDKRLKTTDDENLGKALLEQLMYGETHPYGHPPAGTSMGLTAITLRDVKRHMKQVFGRRRLIIGLGGAFSAQHEKALTSELATMPAGTPRPSKVPAGVLPSSNQMLIATKPDARAVAISMGFPHTSRRGQADWPALLVVQSFLGQHRQMHGLLMEELRDKRRLSYGDYAYAEAFKQDGGSHLPMVNVSRRQQHFELWIRPVAPQDAALSIRLTLLYLDRLVNRGMSEEDFRSAVQFLQGYTRLWSVTPMRQLGYAIDDHFYGTHGYLEELREKLARLTVDDVNEAIRTHLRSQPLFIAAVAPDASAVLEGLRAGGLIRKAYAMQPSRQVMKDDDAAIRAAIKLSDEDVRVVPVEYAFVR